MESYSYLKTKSHRLLRIIVKIKYIIRLMNLREPDLNKRLYLGKPPDSKHPLHALWSIEPGYFSSWMFHGESMLYLWKLITISKPRNILELGSGLSTILFGKYALWLISFAGIIPHVTSIEHDVEWFENSNQLIGDNHLTEYIDHKVLPMVNVEADGFRGMCYDLSTSKDNYYDFILIDGPPYKIGRLLTVPLIINHTSPRATIILDDAQRPSENWIINQWLGKYKSQLVFDGFIPVGNGLGQLIIERTNEKGSKTY